MKNKPSSIIFLFITAIVWGFAFVAQVAGGAHLGTFYFNGLQVYFEKVTYDGE